MSVLSSWRPTRHLREAHQAAKAANMGQQQVFDCPQLGKSCEYVHDQVSVGDECLNNGSSIRQLSLCFESSIPLRLFWMAAHERQSGQV